MIASRTFLFLYGPSGSGKSSLGARLANRLHLPFYELDQLIEQAAGKRIPDIFKEGEVIFRTLESKELSNVLQQPPGVVSLGGGALLDENNRKLAEQHGRVVYLQAALEVLVGRLRFSREVRPLVSAGGQNDPAAGLAALLERRAEHYASFENRLDTSTGSLDELLPQLMQSFGAFYVEGMGNPYPVRVLPGGLDQLGPMLAELYLKGPLALVCDDHLAPLYAERVLAGLEAAGFAASHVTIPSGEEHKTVATVMRIWEGLLSARVERGSTVIALGGGVTGDLTGFAASAFLRGVKWVNLPTSLLAMVDAGLGGKTGADLPQGKNLIGAFYPPALVLSDPRVLETLPHAEQIGGMAEVVKHGIIADPGLFELCRLGLPDTPAAWDELVRRAIAVKIEIIQADPYERGLRMALNLGHTIGHGVEQASGYRLSHGQSIAIGLVAEARLAERLGLAESGLAGRIAEVLQIVGLPTRIPVELDRAEILRAMRLDKKRSDGQVRFSLPVCIGEVRTGVALEIEASMLEE
jgi:3-dehydroquinate synthase